MITYETSALLEAAYTSDWSISTAGVGTGVTATCNTCDDLNGDTLRAITTLTTAPWLGGYALDAMAPVRENGQPGGGNLNLALSADAVSFGCVFSGVDTCEIQLVDSNGVVVDRFRPSFTDRNSGFFGCYLSTGFRAVRIMVPGEAEWGVNDIVGKLSA